jgi:hypothetical protein
MHTKTQKANSTPIWPTRSTPRESRLKGLDGPAHTRWAQDEATGTDPWSAP